MTYKLLMEICFEKKSKRKQPIKNNYRPVFKIKEEGFFSGIIQLIENENLKPGCCLNAVVGFFSDEPFVNVKEEDEFDFYEGPNKIGVSKLIKVIGWKEL